MSNSHAIATLDREEIILAQAAVETFKDSLRGELLCPGDIGYDDARSRCSRPSDKKPALIVRCTR